MGERFRRGGIEVGALASDGERAGLKDLFDSVAKEHGWRPGEDLDADPSRSTRIAAWVDGRLAGGVELRSPDANGRLPLHATWPELRHLRSSGSAELILLALAPEYRGTSGLLWTLCAEAWRHLSHSGASEMFAAATPRNLSVYRRLGWCPEAVGPLRDHWGEPCLPCRIGVAAVAEAVGARARAAPSLASVLEQAHRAWAAL